jgi:Patatin-like phospholipase
MMVVFGSSLDMEYSYLLSSCIICQAPGRLTAHLKPPTAGPRLLVLDGGGIRGIFTLQALSVLDSALDLPYPIYDEFDLILGSSTGERTAQVHLSILTRQGA